MNPDDEMAIRLDERRRIIRELRNWTKASPGVTMYVRDLIEFLKGKKKP